jgi:hypothetical protein
MAAPGEPTTFLIREAESTGKTGTQDAILFDQVRDARVSLVRPPAGHRHHEETHRGYVHDRGSLLYDRDVRPKIMSAQKWDTTGSRHRLE